MKGTNKINPILLLFCMVGLLGTLSCRHETILNKTSHTPEGSWTYIDPVVFECHVEDTNLAYNAVFSLKHTKNYPWSNVFFLITTVFPDLETRIDTLECVLASRDGRWLGRKYGSYYSMDFLYKDGVRFPQTGTYRFEIRHAMREDVHEIVQLGMKIKSR